ncbi:GntR family transcriptional repressor for pyruvate dehydrogenase complex [Prauserella rugosa]|uniref:GntR family transcriptional repressor for pyruvate dehydrogenase complex n=1 Tax=Prauserella rugosa TaxID=43354 RepID=A0A660C7G2_9PSEU|nr:transcriptional regulator [Prauserella sp. Am3]TWH18334.1 GntR family transcriptional repressor for pyruvate dehydrogenase complex [Prauserella rugosa]
MVNLWEPIRPPGSLAARIADRIEELITAEQLRPGDRLPPERELATMLGVSRPSLREAIRSLAARGRLAVRHGQGVFVEEPATTKRLTSSLTSYEHDVDELFAMREVLEVPAAGWAAKNRTETGIEWLQDAYDRLVDATRGTVDWDELQRLDAAFHEAVVRVAGNRFLLRTLGVLNEIMVAGMETTLRMPGRLEKSAAEHARILEAIKDGDSRGAQAAARAHIRGAHAAARKFVEEQGEE